MRRRCKIGPPPVTDNRSGSAPLVLISNGCLICGVSHQVMPAVEVAQQGRMNIARQIWKPLRTDATRLGVRSAVELSGFVSARSAQVRWSSPTRSGLVPRPSNGAW